MIETTLTDLPRYPLASVDHALRIIELLRFEPAMRLSDVARELGVANSTAHRLLAALAHRGFVRQRPDSRLYTAGDALLEIGRTAVLHGELLVRARPLLEKLAADLGETIHLGIREGTLVRYLDAVESTRAVRVAARTGRSLAAHWTSTGKMLLAGVSNDMVRRLYGTQQLPTGTASSIDDIDDLLTVLDECRRVGFAVNSGESEVDVVSVAVALRGQDGTLVAAVSCAAPQHRLAVADADGVGRRMQAIVATNQI